MSIRFGVHLIRSPFDSESVRFGVHSIQSPFDLACRPFANESIRRLVHSPTSPFGAESIQRQVHSTPCPFDSESVRFRVHAIQIHSTPRPPCPFNAKTILPIQSLVHSIPSRSCQQVHPTPSSFDANVYSILLPEAHLQLDQYNDTNRPTQTQNQTQKPTINLCSAPRATSVNFLTMNQLPNQAAAAYIPATGMFVAHPSDFVTRLRPCCR